MTSNPPDFHMEKGFTRNVKSLENPNDVKFW